MAHIETLKADNEQLEARLLDAEAQADRAIAELTAVARRLAEIAERQGRPWWRRLLLTLI
jgi:multidrug efflux pump subunit AcrA (membrane-fusion protein)